MYSGGVNADRRKHPRVTLLPANLRVTNARPYEVVAIVDLSLGGMKLELTGDAPKFGELLDVGISWPSGDAQVGAMVRHVIAKSGEPGRHLVGVEFDDPELVDKLAGDFIRRTIADDEGAH